MSSSSSLPILGVSAALALAMYATPFAAAPVELQSYQVTGSGGPIPAAGSGGGGVWPDVLPAAPFSSSLVLPEYAVSIEEIEINGLVHGSAGELQVVLFDPNGVGHNLVHRVGFGPASPGFAARFGGDYGLRAAGDPDLTHAWPVVDPGPGAMLPSGDYPLEDGSAWGSAWPAGSSGIMNSALQEIPVIPGGIYELVIYDWRFDRKGSCISWAIEGKGLAALPRTYCTSGVSAAACTARINASANPTVGGTNPTIVTIEGAPSNTSAMVMYGIDNSGFIPKPWKGSSSWVCVRGPLARGDLLDTGGSGGCDGIVVFDWSAFQAAHPGALGQPWSIGSVAHLQGFIRDGGSSVTTDAVEITYHP